MSKKWDEAARRHRVAPRSQPEPVKTYEQVVGGITRTLDAFLGGREGRSAKDLLAASNRQIRLAHRSDGSVSDRYFLDGNGLRETSVRCSSAVVWDRDLPTPSISPIGTRAFVEKLVLCDTERYFEPAEVVSYIREQLDEIADAAPTEKRASCSA